VAIEQARETHVVAKAHQLPTVRDHGREGATKQTRRLETEGAEQLDQQPRG
jgi:hypothetical protein